MSTILKTLTDTTYDSVEGYRQAAEKADNPALKQALRARCTKREETLAKLNGELQRHGEELVTKGTVTGELHQMWMSITDMFENGDEAAAERVEEGEDYIKEKFETALQNGDLDAQTRQVVQQCFDEICEGERFGDMIEKQFD